MIKISWKDIKYNLRFGIPNLWFEYMSEPLKEKRKNLLIKRFITKQFKLAKVNMTYEELLEYSKTNSNWFHDFTLTTKQAVKSEKYLLRLLKKIYGKGKFTDIKFSMIMLNYGLRVKD